MVIFSIFFKKFFKKQNTQNTYVDVRAAPFVITLADIEHIHFEGVLANKKNFDMVIVKNDKRTFHMIRAVPMEQLGTIREWLTDIGQTCTYGTIGLKWTSVLETIRAQPEEEFWADVDEEGNKKDIGWECLNAEARKDTDDEDDEDEESAFEVDSEDNEEEEESAYSDESLEEEDSDELDDALYSDDDSDSDKGEDWDTMAKKASNEDKRKRYDRDDDDGGGGGRSKKRSRSSRR